jgi:hypothetical protein
MLQQGIHPKIVSERLGHSSIGITLDTYSHVLPSMQAEAARQWTRSSARRRAFSFPGSVPKRLAGRSSNGRLLTNCGLRVAVGCCPPTTPDIREVG